MIRIQVPSLAIVTLFVATATPLISQESNSLNNQGTITGRVVVSATELPLAGVQVTIPGTGLGTLTNAEGRYLITSVPEGEITVRAQRIGYGTQEKTVVVTTDQTVVVNFALVSEAIGLDEIIVTGTPGGTRRRELGNAVSEIELAAVQDAPINDISDVLKGRVTGMVVQHGAGGVGTGSKITIRGRGSITLDNAPIIYIDGIRVASQTNDQFSGLTAVSRLDDLSPQNIKSIEVIKGPAAATLYGTEASNGVIQIITKKGSVGKPQWNLRVKQGASWFRNPAAKIPLNYWRDTQTGEVTAVNLIRRERNRGSPIFSTGHSQYYGISVGGGTTDFRYYVAGNASLNDGISPDATARRYTGRMNLTISPSPQLQIQTNMGVVIRRLHPMAQGTQGIMRQILWARPTTLDQPVRGFDTAPPEAIRTILNPSVSVNRFTPALTIEHRPTDWFTQRLRTGVDFTSNQTSTFTPRLGPYESQFVSAEEADGAKEVDRETVMATTLDYSGTASLPITDAFQSSTSFGFQFYGKRVERVSAEGDNFLAAGITTIAGAAIQHGFDDYVENNTVGIYVQEKIGWNDRLFLTGAIRADDNSAFGSNYDLVYYPKVSASWVVSDAPFWGVDWMNTLRLRAAYGESGQQPNAFAALRTFERRPTVSGEAAITSQSVGNANLGPERGQEIEVGFNANLLNNRLGVDFTFYYQKTTDALIARNVAPSTGFTGTQLINAGIVTNRGVELQVTGRPIVSDFVDWSLGFNLSTNRNRVVELGLDRFIATGWVGRMIEGYPVGSLWAVNVVSAEFDQNGQPINVQCADGNGGSIPCADASRTYAGHPNPRVWGALNSTVRLGENFRITGLFDFKFGQSKYLTDRWNRCASRQICEINTFPRRFSAEDVAEVQRGLINEWHWFIQDASYIKFRELSVNYSVPDQVLGWVGLDLQQMNVTVAGRNLAVWTDYPGIDPEIVNIEFSDDTPEDQGMIPPLTQIVTSINFTF